MNVVNTRTNICYSCHTRTSHKYMLKKISYYLCISHHGMIYYYKHHHAKPKSLCTVAWGHATHSVGGNVESQKYHILFIFHIPFVTLFLFYPSIKPLIFITFIINMSLYYHFPNHLFLSILSELVVNYWEK